MKLSNFSLKAKAWLQVSALVALGLCTTSPQADVLGVHKSWVAQQYDKSGTKVCMMWSQPEKAEGDYTQRGDIYVFVSRRSDDDAKRTKVRFDAGYDFQPSSTAAVTIDDKTFELVTDGPTAWFLGEEQDAAMISAMRAGRSMVVSGVSNRGTPTKDTYSLYGFSKAYEAINKACQ